MYLPVVEAEDFGTPGNLDARIHLRCGLEHLLVVEDVVDVLVVALADDVDDRRRVDARVGAACR
jgi:hypothetical protein